MTDAESEKRTQQCDWGRCQADTEFRVTVNEEEFVTCGYHALSAKLLGAENAVRQGESTKQEAAERDSNEQ